MLADDSVDHTGRRVCGIASGSFAAGACAVLLVGAVDSVRSTLRAGEATHVQPTTSTTAMMRTTDAIRLRRSRVSAVVGSALACGDCSTVGMSCRRVVVARGEVGSWHAQRPSCDDENWSGRPALSFVLGRDCDDETVSGCFAGLFRHAREVAGNPIPGGLARPSHRSPRGCLELRRARGRWKTTSESRPCPGREHLK